MLWWPASCWSSIVVGQKGWPAGGGVSLQADRYVTATPFLICFASTQLYSIFFSYAKLSAGVDATLWLIDYNCNFRWRHNFSTARSSLSASSIVLRVLLSPQFCIKKGVGLRRKPDIALRALASLCIIMYMRQLFSHQSLTCHVSITRHSTLLLTASAMTVIMCVILISDVHSTQTPSLSHVLSDGDQIIAHSVYASFFF